MNELFSYLINGVALGCGFSLVGSGLVIIHRVTRVVNLTQGTYAVVAGLSTSALLARGVPHGAAELAAILIAALTGLLTGVVAIGKRGTRPEASLIVTLGLGILAYAIEVLIWGDQARSFAGVAGTFDLGGVLIQRQYVLVVGATLLVFCGLQAFFAYSYLGKAVSACASNPYAAEVVGIPVIRMGLLAFTIGGALGGLAGVLLTPLLSVSFDTDVTLLVDGFAAAMLGGLNKPLLALAGGLLLGVAEALVAGYIKASFQTEVALVLMLAIMITGAARRPNLHAESA